MKTIVLIILALTSLSCQIQDADKLHVEPIISIDVTASTEALTLRRTTLSGTVTLGYTSDEAVKISIINNGTALYEGSAPAASLEIPFSQEITLLSEGTNTLIIEIAYQGATLSEKRVVTIDPVLLDLEATVEVGDVSRFNANLSAGVSLGYEPDGPVLFTILDNGVEVAKESVDASGLTARFATNIPLLYEGQNSIVIEASCNGSVLSKEVTLAAALTAPTLTFDTWSQQFIPGFGLIADNMVTITRDASYTIEYVEVSHKEGIWVSADPINNETWGVTLSNPDIGTVEAKVRVGVRYGTHRTMATFTSTLEVDPVFNCTDNPSTLMLPTTHLVSDQSTENRTMVGYFGDPDAYHDVEFVISADVPGDGLYSVVGEVINAGYASLTSSFYVSRLRCNNDPCSMTYNLDLYIDGTYICSRANFGQISNY